MWLQPDPVAVAFGRSVLGAVILDSKRGKEQARSCRANPFHLIESQSINLVSDHRSDTSHSTNSSCDLSSAQNTCLPQHVIWDLINPQPST